MFDGLKKNIAGTILEATRIVKASQKTVIPADAITFKIEASTLYLTWFDLSAKFIQVQYSQDGQNTDLLKKTENALNFHEITQDSGLGNIELRNQL